MSTGAHAASDMETCLSSLQPIERIESCTAVIKAGVSGDEGVKVLVSRGQAYHRMGQDDSSLEDLGKALEIEATDPLIWISRSRALFSKGKHDEAMLDLAEAIKLDPKNSVAVNLMGKNHFMKGNFDIAVKFFDEAIELDANNYSAFVNRATTFYRTNELIKAVKDVNAASLILAPGDPRGAGLKQLKIAIEQAYVSQQKVKPASN
jgi:tetratricopeptide (TPR) repeat protein